MYPDDRQCLIARSAVLKKNGNQIPVPQSPSQTTNGSSSQNLRNQGPNVPLMYQGFQGRSMGQLPQMPGVSQSGVNPNGNVLMQVADLLR